MDVKRGDAGRNRDLLYSSLVLVALLSLLVVQLLVQNVCTSGGANPVEARDASGCYDYFFNRYQTLIGAIVALAAAALAWSAVRTQIKEAAKQSAAAAIGPLRAEATDIEKEIEAIDWLTYRLDRIGEDVDDSERALRQRGDLPRAQLGIRIHEDLAKGTRLADQAAENERGEDTIQVARRAYAQAQRDLNDAVVDFRRLTRNFPHGEQDREGLTGDEERALATIRSRLQGVHDSVRVVRMLALHDLASVRRSISALARQMV